MGYVYKNIYMRACKRFSFYIFKKKKKEDRNQLFWMERISEKENETKNCWQFLLVPSSSILTKFRVGVKSNYVSKSTQKTRRPHKQLKGEKISSEKKNILKNPTDNSKK